VSAYWPYIVSGLVTGSIIAIAALGLVLSYKTSGLLNFGHGAVAAAGAYVFYDINTRAGLPWPIAGILAILVFGVLAGLVMERLSRELSGALTAYRVVATVGILIAIRQIAMIRYGPIAISTPHFLPTGSHEVGGVFVTNEQFIIAGIALLAAVGLNVFFKLTTLGRAMRAVVDDPALLDMTGVDPNRVRRVAWVLGCSFASLSGVLFAPTFVLDATLLTLLVVQAFSAAAIGMFSRLPMVYVGGLAVGVLQQLATKVGGSHPRLSGLSASVPFLVLLIVLLVAGPRLRELGSVGVERVRVARTRSGPRVVVGAAAAGVGLALVPWVVGTKLPIWSSGLAQGLLFLSLALLIRAAGMVSLCQVALAAVGAAGFGHLAGNMGLPWLPALILAGLFAVPFGAIVAVPAIRLSGLFLALATFGFGILMQQQVYSQPFMFGQFAKVLDAPRPAVLGLDGEKGFYYVLLLVLAVGVALVASIDRGRLGRLLRAMADSPSALGTLGINVQATRVIVFCISAFLAGISGALVGQLNGKIDANAFPVFTSLILVAVLAVSGRGVVVPAIVATFAYIIIPGYIASARLNDYLGVIFGVAAVLAAVASTRVAPSLRSDRAITPNTRARSRWRARASAAGAIPGSIRLKEIS
jgi:branched-subunit amino acid ABC-type transport system permease component